MQKMMQISIKLPPFVSSCGLRTVTKLATASIIAHFCTYGNMKITRYLFKFKFVN